MRKALLILVVFAYVSVEPGAVGFVPAEGLNNRTAIHAQSSAVPIIQIESAGRFAQNQPLVFRCKIKNFGSEPVYIYSTLLQNPRFAEINIDRKQKVIELRFSRLETSPILPYYFPGAAFREINPNQSEDFLVTTQPIKELQGFETINGASREARITAGHWTFRIMIGYGNDLSAVKLALASDVEGKEHPINNIVRWQKVGFSNSVAIQVTK